MCLLVTSEKKIAEKDILVFKVGHADAEYFYPCYKNYQYTKNRMQYEDVEMVVVPYEGYDIIQAGYHSYKNYKVQYSEEYGERTVGVFLIPEGASYYEGFPDSYLGVPVTERSPDDAQYVSSNLIYVGNLEEYWQSKLSTKQKLINKIKKLLGWNTRRLMETSFN